MPFRKSNKYSLERRAVAYLSSKEKTPCIKEFQKCIAFKVLNKSA
jgi:hypothetical protein